MKCRALETIQRHHLLTPGAAVIVAVSGGADSMALLFFLNEIREEFHLTLSAAHINHGLRGAEADRDELLVRNTCKRLKIPLSILHTDVAQEAKQTGEGIEECGRRVRYAYLEALNEQALIATAHTLDDQLETFLMHFAARRRTAWPVRHSGKARADYPSTDRLHEGGNRGLLCETTNPLCD